MRRALLLSALVALVSAAPASAQEPPPPPEEPPPPVIADGVTVAGLPVGGLTEEEAIAALRARFAEPLRIRLRTRVHAVRPATLGAWARVYAAVQAALAASADQRVPLEVVVQRRKLHRWVRDRARRFDRAPRNARLFLKSSLRPRITRARPGRKLLPNASARALRRELRRHERGPVALPTRRLRPTVRPRSFGPVVVIRRGSRSLWLYRGRTSGGMRLVRVFRVAVGQPSYPTPLGRFRIVSKQRNPWWYPPSAGWASGASPIPPGPGNPLGTRWMGLSVGAVGIHGTYNSASIGGFASHGCIRMYLREAEWLFERVRLGTTVFIVGA
ncbi:MAG TPA: L,D-transpeptidase [Gaiellaceae bacterium]|nr:L,D-transpeptidase [Gaiellaceae bacterium]